MLYEGRGRWPAYLVNATHSQAGLIEAQQFRLVHAGEALPDLFEPRASEGPILRKPVHILLLFATTAMLALAEEHGQTRSWDKISRVSTTDQTPVHRTDAPAADRRGDAGSTL